MRINLIYKNATVQDTEPLTETAKLSKQDWGYSDLEMKLWEDDLTLTEDYILKNKVIKVYSDEKFIGFFALVIKNNQEAEIDHLWLLPDQKRKGYGAVIFKYILDHLKETNFKKAILVAEPNAKGFYDKMNGIVTGKFQSKIKDRYLDIYHYTL